MTSDPARLDALYREAVMLADSARGWFDGPGKPWAAAQPVAARARIATESLAITARLMRVIAWALHPGHASDTAPLLRDTTEPPFPPDHPLAGTPGELIAQASRRLDIALKDLA
ncbi:hypothetical protein GCM10007973_26380 [Polymorphobacter multimanifer]|uniref:Regulator of CtrA degradation n=1 Tax=Polymorphobacter multimanifer TaxID=1070431 RepID=A0A841LAL7_9SPHN|nr:DUF1465 family protein [Polymorphobacter multimanifer]MBB6228013.1 regulator of CtrA degradation [Polymorphobacter multimanifer]GGI88738.1 hypothetical protein GCM10007973_26380 [Polymorphobacter multimanifer]